jgi:outer membrane protein
MSGIQESIVKRFSIIALAASAALAAGLVQAQAQTDLKIGVVSYNRLLQESPQAKKTMEALRVEFAPKQQDLVKLNASLKAKADALEKNRATMTADQVTKAEKELRDGQREFSQKQTDFQEDANTRQNEEMSKLEAVLVKEVQTYAQAQKYDLVVASNGILYSNNTLDITANVLAVLKASDTTAPAAAPAPAGK